MSSMGPEDRERFARRELDPERETTMKAVAGGSITEAVCGIGTVVLAILGLARIAPGFMASIATIAFGVALLAQGGAVAARYARVARETSPEWGERAELGGGMGAELLAGAAGIVLGILGLLGIATDPLIPIAIIVFGGALLLGSSATVDVGAVPAPGASARLAHAARQATAAASGAQVLLGIAAIVLGIIALVGVDPLVVSLVALLALGASVAFSGAAVGGRVANLLHKT